MDKLISFVEKLKQERKIETLGEEATKQSIILPVLNILGWEVFESEVVFPEFSIENMRVDYALRDRLNNKVFIEVKRTDQDLEKHQDQLLEYAFRQGVKLAILTNGMSWWFYLPLHEGSWEQRKFFSIDIYSQSAVDIAKYFFEFLQKQIVLTGKAIANAESYYNNKQKGQIIGQTIEKAWKKLLTNADEFLVELLAETTEKLCGFKPDNERVVEFLSTISSSPEVISPNQGQSQIRARRRAPSSVDSYVVASSSQRHGAGGGSSIDLEFDYTGRSIENFNFLGKKYNVNSWRDFLIGISSIVIELHPKKEYPQEFKRLLSLRGRKRNYYSLDPHGLKSPGEVGRNVYVEGNMNANSIVKLVKSLMSIYNYADDTLGICLRII